MTRLEAMADPAWVPTNDDVLYARVRTTGLNETIFKMEKYEWALIDVGGQSTERRKWVRQPLF